MRMGCRMEIKKIFVCLVAGIMVCTAPLVFAASSDTVDIQFDPNGDIDIDVSHADSEAELRFLAAFAASGKFVNDDKSGFYHHVKDPNGGSRTVFFYARKGHQLPTGSM